MAYRVTAACVQAHTYDTQLGTAVTLFYAGALLPEDVPQSDLTHLLSLGMIVDETPAKTTK